VRPAERERTAIRAEDYRCEELAAEVGIGPGVLARLIREAGQLACGCTSGFACDGGNPGPSRWNRAMLRARAQGRL